MAKVGDAMKYTNTSPVARIRKIAETVNDKRPIWQMVADAEFDEDLHPRDEAGKFTSGGESSSSSRAEVKTRADAIDRLKDLGFKNVKIDDVNDNAAIRCANTLSNLEGKIGAMAGAKLEIKADSLGMYAAQVSHDRIDPTEQILTLSKNEYGAMSEDSLVNSEREAVESGYAMPCDTSNREELLSYNITHEYGHMVENKLLKQEMEKDADYKREKASKMDFKSFRGNHLKWYNSMANKVAKQAHKDIVAIAKKNNPNFKEFENISRYGQKDHHEFFAECFANSQLSRPNELGKAMQEYLKQKGVTK